MQRWIAKDPVTGFDVEYQHMVTKEQVAEAQRVTPREPTPGYRPDVSWETLNDGRLVRVIKRVPIGTPIVAGDGLDARSDADILTIVGLEQVPGITKKNFYRPEAIARIRAKREAGPNTKKETVNGPVPA